ncbi:His-Xaa-Ser system radical SAM maturase HxsB [Vibrio sp. MACH09]|uniref:His-Xaa-Ser system radical SAM maturase HxsB n=1 Tax=Vibrio sp. MACH09 TaxID=3025122 RepID=UPI002792A12D|nr:His-Xaa-Ser system radical SAM maturase HxsB [Vibrio sp. MACH09]GLO63463.1 His-Xaa-Ser system radical SAM maturase HxsB [Vibrio sp. MACH09]
MSEEKLKRFKAYEEFKPTGYRLLPFRFERLSSSSVLAVNEVGEFCYLTSKELVELIEGKLPTNGALFHELLSKSFVFTDGYSSIFRTYASKYRARKSFIKGGPALHIFVTTLRCDNSCEYCQVSRKGENKHQYDMSISDAEQFVYRMFESPSNDLTVEFQGGESLLAFEQFKFIVELCEKVNLNENKNLQFVITTNLQSIDNEKLAFCKEHDVHVSTSLDGPEWLHNINRPNSCRNSYELTIKGIDKTRTWLGDDKVAAMTTITKASLGASKAIVDEYVKHGFHSIFLRPLNMYGFAVKKENKVSYTSEEFNRFYFEALAHIIDANKQGYHLDEVNAALALNNILTPRPMGYVDMRSPCGDGTGVLVYNYNGKVYPSDESRMLVEMGDDSLCLGKASDSYQSLMSSEPIRRILDAGVAEALPGCSDCAYLPYCGVNPVQNLSRSGDMIGHRSFSSFCDKQKYLYKHVFELMKDESNKKVLMSWLTNQGSEILEGQE